MNDNNLGNRISDLLKRSGLTQRELADRVGVTEITMTHIINGDRIPKGIHTNMKGGINMMATRENTLDNQTEDVKEFISLLKDLDYGEKREIKGIMIGIRLTKQLNAARV